MDTRRDGGNVIRIVREDEADPTWYGYGEGSSTTSSNLTYGGDEARLSESFQISTFGSFGLVDVENGRTYCKQYFTDAGCPFGDNCIYFHDEEARIRERLSIGVDPRSSGGFRNATAIRNNGLVAPPLLAPLPAWPIAPPPAWPLAPLPARPLAQLPARPLAQLPARPLAQLPARPLAPLLTWPLAPQPARPLAPLPARSLAPLPARPLAPLPARPLSPRPARRLASRPARPLTPWPAQPLALQPARSVAPWPARSVAPLAGRPLAPLPARPLAPRPARPLAPRPARPLALLAGRPLAPLPARPPLSPLRLAQTVPNSNRRLSSWRTKICRRWEQTGFCRFGNECSFAHGEAELRRVANQQVMVSHLTAAYGSSAVPAVTASAAYAGRQQYGGRLVDNQRVMVPPHLAAESGPSVADAGGSGQMARTMQGPIPSWNSWMLPENVNWDLCRLE